MVGFVNRFGQKNESKHEMVDGYQRVLTGIVSATSWLRQISQNCSTGNRSQKKYFKSELNQY